MLFKYFCFNAFIGVYTNTTNNAIENMRVHYNEFFYYKFIIYIPSMFKLEHQQLQTIEKKGHKLLAKAETISSRLHPHKTLTLNEFRLLYQDNKNQISVNNVSCA